MNRETYDPAPSVFRVLGFSPVFGFFFEGDAEDRGAAVLGRPNPRRVRFLGENVERVRPVFPELKGLLTPEIIAALNELIEASAGDLPEPPDACTRFRRTSSRINLVPRHRRKK